MNGHRRLLAGVHRQQIGTQIIDDKEGQRDHTAVPDHPPGQSPAGRSTTSDE